MYARLPLERSIASATATAARGVNCSASAAEIDVYKRQPFTPNSTRYCGEFNQPERTKCVNADCKKTSRDRPGSFSVSIWGILLLVQLAAEGQDGHQRGGDGGDGVDEDREPKRAYAEGRENEQYDFYQRGSAGSGVRAVSYTHLDVYKRQLFA